MEERPRLVAPESDKSRLEVFRQFTKSALQREVDTLQTLADLQTGQAEFKTNSDIRANIENIFAVTSGGVEIDFDQSTWEQIMLDKGYAESTKLLKQARTAEERNKLRRNVVLHALGIYTTRLSKYNQSRKTSGNVA